MLTYTAEQALEAAASQVSSVLKQLKSNRRPDQPVFTDYRWDQVVAAVKEQTGARRLSLRRVDEALRLLQKQGQILIRDHESPDFHLFTIWVNR